MNICEPGQGRNAAALSINIHVRWFLNNMTKDEQYMLLAIEEAKKAALEEPPSGWGAHPVATLHGCPHQQWHP